MNAEEEKRLMHLLKLAGEYEMRSILESDETFDRWLKANPLTEQEQVEVNAMVKRLVDRFRKA